MYVSVHVSFPGKYHTEAEVNISTSLDSFSLKAKNINFLLRGAIKKKCFFLLLVKKRTPPPHLFWPPQFFLIRISWIWTEHKICYRWIYSATNVSSWKIHSLEMLSNFGNDLAGRFNNHHHRFYLKIPYSRNVFPTSCWSRSSSLF